MLEIYFLKDRRELETREVEVRRRRLFILVGMVTLMI